MLNTTVNGSQSASNEFQVDGALIANAAEWAGDFRNIPFPQDAVAEFKVLTLNPPAEYGRTGQGLTSFTIRSGTNQFHGSAYEFVRNQALDANTFFSNSTVDATCTKYNGTVEHKPCRPINKQNEFGATIGGPIRRDKTFFFGWYQGFRLRKETAAEFDTVPTVAKRGGDLSNVLGAQIATCGAGGNAACLDALGRPVFSNEIYDPATQRTVTAGAVDPATGLVNTSGSSAILRDAFGFNKVTGQPIPGQANIIPGARIDPVAKNIFSYFPNPTSSGTQFGYVNNWLITNPTQSNTNQWGAKIDHAITENNRIMGEFMWLKNDNPTTGRYPVPISEGAFSFVNQDVARFSHDLIIRPNLVNHWTAGFNRWGSSSISRAGLGWPEKLGIKGVPQTGPGSVFPGLNIGGLGNTYGNGGQNVDVLNAFTFDESLTWTKSRHTIKAGFSYVKMQENGFGYGRQSGYFNFNAGAVSLPGAWYNDNCNHGGDCPGLGIGGFLLGLGSSGEADVYTAGHDDRLGQYAGYIQDDFKATSKLTFNLGLRYDLLLPVVSAHNQVSWMDPLLPNPGAGGRLGAVRFATPGRRTGVDAWTKGFGPRIGFAYALNDKTVLRGGYGILYTTGGAQRSSRGLFVQGFNSTNNLAGDTSTPFLGLLPSFTFSGGWPASRFPAPPFIDPTYGLSSSPHPIFPGDGRPPDIQNWTLGIQRQIPGQILLDVAYVGTGGRHLVSRLMPTNAMPTKNLSYQDLIFTDIADPSVQALPVVQGMPVDPATGVHSPFAGFQALYGGTPQLGQALRPFPQYTQESLSQMRDFMEGVGVSSYNALQVQARKQFSQGLTFLASYTWSKTLTDAKSIFSEFSVFTQDFYNRKPERALSINDYPQNLVLSYEYQLPFGPGKKFASSSGPAGKVVGGWSVAGIQQYQSGRPNMIFTGSNPYTPYVEPNSFLTRPNVVPGVPKKTAAYASGHFDPKVDPLLNFNAWTTPPKWTLGNAPRSDGGVRLPAYLNEDISLLKRTPITERVHLELRADFLNIFNRVVLGPDQGGDQYDAVLQGNALSGGPGSFGLLTNQGNYPREIQFGLRITY